MKKTFKTSEIMKAYNIISNAKYGKLTDDDKIKVWKITRSLKPIATKFDEDIKDAQEKMKPAADFDENLKKAQEYERLIRDPKTDASKLPMGAAEYDKFIEEFKEYQKLIDKAIKEFADKENSIEIEAINDNAMSMLMASNDWTFEQVMAVGEVICD